MKKPKRSFMADFREFFFRGLGIVLPTILTIWILVAVYSFVDLKIASPINAGIKQVVLNFTPWPEPNEDDYKTATTNLTQSERTLLSKSPDTKAFLRPYARRSALEREWNSITIGGWVVSNVIGLVIAIILIYVAGLMLGSFLGKRLYNRGEEMFKRLPIIKQVYPSVKQVTDFLFGGSKGVDGKEMFNKVVAVEYPRKGLWSIGLVTGDTMREITKHAGEPCMTIFVPSSPTPFTGYVITVPRKDTIELPISVDQALKFTVSGGVIVPESQHELITGDQGNSDSIEEKSSPTLEKEESN